MLEADSEIFMNDQHIPHINVGRIPGIVKLDGHRLSCHADILVQPKSLIKAHIVLDIPFWSDDELACVQKAIIAGALDIELSNGDNFNFIVTSYSVTEMGWTEFYRLEIEVIVRL